VAPTNRVERSDYPVGFPLTPLVMQIAVSSVSVCLSLTDVDCFVELNCPSVTFIAFDEPKKYLYCIKLNFHPYFEFEVFLVFQISWHQIRSLY